MMLSKRLRKLEAGGCGLMLVSWLVNLCFAPAGMSAPVFEAYKQGADLQAKGRYQEAIPYFDEAIRLNPNYGSAYFNRAVSYKKLGENQKAIDDWTEAILVHPNDADAYSNRGGAYKDLGQLKRAIEDFDKAINLDPRNL